MTGNPRTVRLASGNYKVGYRLCWNGGIVGQKVDTMEGFWVAYDHGVEKYSIGGITFHLGVMHT